MRIKIVLSSLAVAIALALGGVVHAESACKGLSKNKCGGGCTWVDSYKTKTGNKVSGYCRAKPGKAAAGAKQKATKSADKAKAQLKDRKAKVADKAKKKTKDKADKMKKKVKEKAKSKADKAKKSAKDKAAKKLKSAK